ncbi:hypothetical protein QQX98_006871 [Neonectria punicea]|uniref:C2H2-type domain-containing protein n=1 Tax=Neonectria punicea TaxID=979145 RepID=A0ABR1H071_9HYPO
MDFTKRWVDHLRANHKRDLDGSTSPPRSRSVGRQLWSPDGPGIEPSQFDSCRGQSVAVKDTIQPSRLVSHRRRPVAGEANSRPQSVTTDPDRMMQQPETRPISQDQLVAEVKGIYAGLVMVEAKCIEVDNAQSSNTDDSKLNNEQWQALIALHRTLLHEHHDFFLASQHPSASAPLRTLAAMYASPKIQSFMDLQPPKGDKPFQLWLDVLGKSSSLLGLLSKNDRQLAHPSSSLDKVLELINGILDRLGSWFWDRFDKFDRTKPLLEILCDLPSNMRHISILPSDGDLDFPTPSFNDFELSGAGEDFTILGMNLDAMESWEIFDMNKPSSEELDNNQGSKPLFEPSLSDVPNQPEQWFSSLSGHRSSDTSSDFEQLLQPELQMNFAATPGETETKATDIERQPKPALKCPECPDSAKTYSTPFTLKRHRKAKHSGPIRRFPCPHPDCDKSQHDAAFERDEQLQRHLRSRKHASLESSTQHNETSKTWGSTGEPQSAESEKTGRSASEESNDQEKRVKRQRTNNEVEVPNGVLSTQAARQRYKAMVAAVESKKQEYLRALDELHMFAETYSVSEEEKD